MGDLGWPPVEEDLRRLYLEQKLSAAKIALVYGLKHPNPKSGETLVLYHLKKFGIQRCDSTEHVKKVTQVMVDDWVRRYQKGESLKRIAGETVDPVTVWNRLKKVGIPLRDRVEAQIKAVSKYQRLPFSGDRLEKAYMMGLRYGDLHVIPHGRAIRVRVSTTHPAMADLFQKLFSPYGHVSRYPRAAKLVGHEWSLECDLDKSFDFLMTKADLLTLESLPDDAFLAFLAGVFDAEGSVVLHKKRARCDPELFVTNSEAELVDCLSLRLKQLGLHAYVRWKQQRANRAGVTGQSRMARIEILRFREAQGLLQLLPIRHSEKVAKRELVFKLSYMVQGEQSQVIAREWKALSKSIHRQRDEFIELARTSLAVKSNHSDST